MKNTTIRDPRVKYITFSMFLRVESMFSTMNMVS
jgi:hypothetical protein